MSLMEERPWARDLINQINVQVLLERDSISTVTWIPAHLAKVGQGISLRQKDGTWDEGWTWTVKETYASANGHDLAHRCQQLLMRPRRGRLVTLCDCFGFGEAAEPPLPFPYDMYPYLR